MLGTMKFPVADHLWLALESGIDFTVRLYGLLNNQLWREGGRRRWGRRRKRRRGPGEEGDRRI